MAPSTIFSYLGGIFSTATQPQIQQEEKPDKDESMRDAQQDSNQSTRRDLSNGEPTTTLASRLQTTNHSSSTTQSQKVDGRLERVPRPNTTTHSYITTPIPKANRRLELQQEHRRAASEATVPFPQFTGFPKEIRERIWELSLPEPRLLTLNGGCNRDSSALKFRKDSQAPKPVALDVCRESREVALRRYKLCFDSLNLYANLPGGDILYIHPFFNVFGGSGLDRLWKWGTATAGEGPSTTKVDLDSVIHIALPNRDRHGAKLSRELSKFPSLRRISFIHNSGYMQTINHPIIENRAPRSAGLSEYHKDQLWDPRSGGYVDPKTGRHVDPNTCRYIDDPPNS